VGNIRYLLLPVSLDATILTLIPFCRFTLDIANVGGRLRADRTCELRVPAGFMIEHEISLAYVNRSWQYLSRLN
jgi:hypothetical protein